MNSSDKKPTEFRIEGQVQLDAAETGTHCELDLKAYVFDNAGQLIGKGDVDARGSYSVALHLTQPMDVELVVGPQTEASTIRQSSAYVRKLTAKDWGNAGRIQVNPAIASAVWKLWLPVRICVSGHVLKAHTENGHTQVCPVPFVKVEIFDVDREGCFWPFLYAQRDKVANRPIVRLPDLLQGRIPLPPLPEPTATLKTFKQIDSIVGG